MLPTDQSWYQQYWLHQPEASDRPKLLSDVSGLAIIVICLEAGDVVRGLLHIPVSASVIGMTLLLLLLWSGVIREVWVAGASGWLLFLLPAMFVPIYVAALAEPEFWVRYGAIFLPLAMAGAFITLNIVAALARRMVRR
jgi:holin-like protein